MRVDRACFLSIDAPAYVSRLAFHSMQRKVIPRQTVPDPRNALTALVEQRVREALAATFALTPWRVLRFDRRDCSGASRTDFRELDGVFQQGKRVTILEVKASSSAKGLAQGRKRLAENVAIAKQINRTWLVSGLLVAAPLGLICSAFAAHAPLEIAPGGSGISIRPWMPSALNDQDTIVATVTPLSTLEAWTDVRSLAAQVESEVGQARGV